MARIIVITSGKGGVGKTTVTANIGIALTLMGFRVVLLDGDCGLNNLDVVLGLENRIEYDLMDVIEGRVRLKECVVRDVYNTNMDLLSISRAKYSGAFIPIADMRGIVTELSYGYDFILIDSPAGIDEGFHLVANIAGEALVVTNPSAAAVRDAGKVLGLLTNYPLLDVALIINRVRFDLVRAGAQPTAVDLGNMLNTRVMGVLPENNSVTVGNRIDSPYRDEVSLEAFMLLADNLTMGTSRHFDCKKKNSLLHKLFKK